MQLSIRVDRPGKSSGSHFVLEKYFLNTVKQEHHQVNVPGFIHVLNFPHRIRANVWPLFAVWVGDILPANREVFLIELTVQLRDLQEGSTNFQPVEWIDEDGLVVKSAVYVHSVMADSPERAALNGQLGRAAAQGCIYCTQVLVLCSRYFEQKISK